MAANVNQYAYEIDSVIVCKFGALITGMPTRADLKNSIDITPQILEINLFESIFSSVIRAEIAVADYIGLQVNFPISGEEAVFIRYRNVADDTTRTLYMIINNVSDIGTADDTRATAYMLNCVAIEAYANGLQTVQQAWLSTIPECARSIYDLHIAERLKLVFPAYPGQPLLVEDNATQPTTIVIPNLHPFSAIQMLADISVPENDVEHIYLFFQTTDRFNFVTLQSLFNDGGRSRKRARAREFGYKYMSNQIDDESSEMQNEGRVVTNLIVNKRLSSFQKLTQGYFHNNLFEINIGQKAFWAEHTYTDETTTMYPAQLNTEVYKQLAIRQGDDEQSNRTKYMITTHREADEAYPISRYRERWGPDMISNIAMGQVDLTVTIPGTSRFSAGDLFWLEIPEMHGFNEIDVDDLISGLFLITEVKHVLHAGGFHSTVLRINKDSYSTTVDRPSRYE